MKIRTKLVSAGAAVGLLASYSMVSLPQVGAADDGSLTVPLACSGSDENTQALIDAGLGGELSIGMKVTPDADNPESASNGEVVPVSFKIETELSDELRGLAVDVLGVDELSIVDFNLGISASGGGVGGPYMATPDEFTVSLNPYVSPVTNASGDVTISDASEVTVFSIDNPTTFSVVIEPPEGSDGERAQLNLTCDAESGFFFGAINGEAPEPPSTTTTTAAPTTTTTIDTSAQTDSNVLATVCSFTATGNGRDITSVVQKQMGSSTIAVNLKVDATTPKQLGSGQSGDVSFSVSMPMDANTQAMAKNPAFKVSAISLTNINLQIQANGGGQGGPYRVLWNGTDSYTADLTTFTSPSGSASGKISITDSSVPTYFTVVNPLTYTTTVTTGILGTIQMNMNCDVQVKGFGAINGSAPAAAPTPAPAAARFAG